MCMDIRGFDYIFVCYCVQGVFNFIFFYLGLEGKDWMFNFVNGSYVAGVLERRLRFLYIFIYSYQQRGSLEMQWFRLRWVSVFFLLRINFCNFIFIFVLVTVFGVGGGIEMGVVGFVLGKQRVGGYGVVRQGREGVFYLGCCC